MFPLRKIALVAAVFYPVVKRQNEGTALGFVAVRTVEAAMIFTVS